MGQAGEMRRAGQSGRRPIRQTLVAAAGIIMLATYRPIGFAAWQPASQNANLPMFSYQVQHIYPHDPNAFTQGLQFVNGVLYEGTGLNGRSSIRRVSLETGKVLKQRDISAEHFGEGITVFKNELFELTWQTGVAFVYDKTTLAPRRSFHYQGEGWGLTHDGTNLIMSDGTNELRILDPVTFAERRRLKVTAVGAPLKNLNELEYVKGEILANVWQTDYVARISPATGNVIGYIDLRGLLTTAERAKTDVLNGIAYDEAHDRLFITGKLWPKLFEVKLTSKK
jgi:glutaminyl-peptide cyclotransferase